MSFAPPPIREPVGTRVWLDWFRELYRRVEPVNPGNGGELVFDSLTVSNLTVTDQSYLNDLTVSGDSTFANITVTGPSVFSDITVNGTSFINDLTVSGSSTFETVTVNGDIVLSGIITGGQYSVSDNTNLTDDTRSVLVTVTGKTITLPPASTARVGGTWTVMLGVSGYVDITVSGSDTLNLPVTDTTIRLTNKGASVSLRCTSATSWSIV